MRNKLLALSLVLLLILPLLISCTGTGNSGVALVPQTANTIVEVQVGQILSDMVLQGVYSGLAQNNPSWPQTEDAAVNQILLKTGLDLSGVSTAVFFADIESNDQTQNTYKGVIASGNFNETTSIAKIKQQT
jgi:capsular polysaccharide biosynthesis protein